MIEPWVLDLDGVIWLGNEPIPGAASAVERLQSAGADVVFVTNMSRLTEGEQEAKLASHGIDATGAVMTSAMAAGGLVSPGDRVVVVGGPGIDEAVEKRGGRVVADGPAELVVVGIDPGFDYDELTRAMLAVRGGARLVGTNHDPTYPTADGLKPGGGAIVAAIAAAAEVSPTFAGKPHATAAALVRERLGGRGLMVGDRPDSDGLFAVELGYDFGLVLSGVTSSADLPVEPTPAVVAGDLAALVEERLGST
ncbi:MAG: HAD hydrolase-like protein [Actinomycetota bacterium]